MFTPLPNLEPKFSVYWPYVVTVVHCIPGRSRFSPLWVGFWYIWKDAEDLLSLHWATGSHVSRFWDSLAWLDPFPHTKNWKKRSKYQGCFSSEEMIKWVQLRSSSGPTQATCGQNGSICAQHKLNSAPKPINETNITQKHGHNRISRRILELCKVM